MKTYQGHMISTGTVYVGRSWKRFLKRWRSARREYLERKIVFLKKKDMLRYIMDNTKDGGTGRLSLCLIREDEPYYYDGISSLFNTIEVNVCKHILPFDDGPFAVYVFEANDHETILNELTTAIENKLALVYDQLQSLENAVPYHKEIKLTRRFCRYF